MIGLKLYEKKAGRRTVLSKKISGFDYFLLQFLFDAKQNMRIFFINLKAFLLKQIILYLSSFFGSVKSHIDEKYMEFHSNFRGKRVLNNKGSASFYLRDIIKYKSNNFKD